MLPELAFNKNQSGQHSSENVNFETSSNDGHGKISLLLSDNEISEKLESFSGAITGLD